MKPSPFFFNLLLLERVSGNNPDKIVNSIKALLDDKILSKDYIKGLANGNSFLLNPIGLIKSKYDTIFKAQYIRLAGRRNYIHYKTYKDTFLDISLYPEINKQAIKQNTLLTLIDNKLYFKFEEL